MDLGDLHPVLLGFGASLVSSLGTTFGALGIYTVRRMSRRTRSVLLGAAAGIMLAATVFSLFLPGLEAATRTLGGEAAGFALAAAGALSGAFGVLFLDRFAPHEHFVKGPEGVSTERLARIWLFVIAIAIHNFPEGLAVGVGYASGGSDVGAGLALGIWLQNLPEGLAVAVSLTAVGYGRARASLWAAAVWLAAPALPFALTFAAGAMLYVVSHEVIPETHRDGEERVATLALVVGFLTMTGLDVLLG